ncbi:MAG: hypothetical protein A2X25_00645 [Chloroflexi bacterium GWB2_49_20]|nr:MAG: hypothetical protein A2X25_00645 [Chloroflexi bacterium GWB2_49_20]OGN80186.1 MAG: hypothetical protein A2X26_09500 [Chloroflexi bacterium GWC2_49_37]OGN83159.1 MAG: hypothetical protein A2X27_13260 [Chloroflexi bacterium GWD2_49_16]
MTPNRVSEVFTPFDCVFGGASQNFGNLNAEACLQSSPLFPVCLVFHVPSVWEGGKYFSRRGQTASQQVRCGRISGMQVQKVKLPPPPGLIPALAAGFDAIANHVAIILLPALLDMLLWLGPRLRMKTLMQPVMDQLANTSVPLSASLPDPASLQQLWTEFLTRFNLFGLLRTFPVGTASLMSSSMPDKSPLGVSFTWEVSSFSGMLGSWLLLITCGWLLGCLYFYWVSGISLALGQKRSLKKSMLQSVLLSFTWLGLAILAGIPSLLGFSLLLLINPVLAQIGIFIIMLMGIWVILPVFFSPHGIFAYEQNAFASIMQSLRMMRFTLPTSGLFLLGSLLISEGLGYLWRIPPTDSWLTLVAIIGHAFISTGLLAASFIYFRDINLWLQTVFEQIKAKQTPV